MSTDDFLDEIFPNPPDLRTGFKELKINYDEIRFASVPNSPAKKEEIYEGLVRMKLSICHPSNRTNFSAMISTR